MALAAKPFCWADSTNIQLLRHPTWDSKCCYWLRPLGGLEPSVANGSDCPNRNSSCKGLLPPSSRNKADLADSANIASKQLELADPAFANGCSLQTLGIVDSAKISEFQVPLRHYAFPGLGSFNQVGSGWGQESGAANGSANKTAGTGWFGQYLAKLGLGCGQRPSAASGSGHQDCSWVGATTVASWCFHHSCLAAVAWLRPRT